MRKLGTGEKGESKQDQEMGQCHTSTDGVRKAPGNNGKGLQKPPTGPQTPDLCTLGSYEQDISLEGIPEHLLSTKFGTSVTSVATHQNATAGNKRTM